MSYGEPFRIRITATCGVILLAGLLIGCEFLNLEAAHPKEHVDTATQDGDLSSYEFAPGDQVKITTLEHPDASAQAAVAEDGTIEMPLIGAIKVAGLTALQLREMVTQALDKDFIVNPKVNVEILKYQSFYILGEVRSPGSFEYQPGMNVRIAVAVAGGFTRLAARDSIEITRPLHGRKQSFPGTFDTHVLPGDVIEIERRWF
ncbi:MAG: hypothetical protein CMM47_01780 [Rhodospirillaceae bacterium]|nr:hypothetical protein [Rhodospirillaceae bacterium]